MTFTKVVSEKLSLAVVRQVELLILRGILRPGDKLPAERALAEQLGVSRPSLREALADLERAGLVTTKPGSGVFVADVLGSAFSPALIQLFANHKEAVMDALAFRKDIEGLAAERATRLASDADLAVIDTLFQRMMQSQSPNSETEAQADAEFHMAIIEAGHNVVMLHMMRSIYDLLRRGVFYNRQIMFAQHTTRAALMDQHHRINAAIQRRDGPAAKAAVEAHLEYVQSALSDHEQQQAHAEIARLKYEHEQNRQ